MMQPRPWQPSAQPSAMRWTWSSCASTCWLSCRRRCSLPTSRCGCVHLHKPAQSRQLGAALLLPLKRGTTSSWHVAHLVEARKQNITYSMSRNLSYSKKALSGISRSQFRRLVLDRGDETWHNISFTVGRSEQLIRTQFALLSKIVYYL